MKRIFIYTFFITSIFSAFSQYSNFNDIGVLATKKENYGTARFNAMSGAFGALGSDISATAINPASGAISITGKASVTLGINAINSNANYYNNTLNNQDEFFNLSQAGATLVLEEDSEESDWNRFALTFNYNIKSDFEGNFNTNGNGDLIKFTSNPNEENENPYNQRINQKFNRNTNGQSSEFNIGFSGVYDTNLIVGASLNFHNFDYTEVNRLQEINKDINNNKLDAINVTESRYEGTGFSLALGAIYKITPSIRIGVAYETPTWYEEVLEDSNIFKQDSNNEYKTNFPGLVDIITTDPYGQEEITYKTANKLDGDPFSMRTPSRVTLSGAYIFGKKGLISIDYTYKGYKNTKFSEGDFTEVNQAFNTQYRNTHALNIGTEWRFKELSIRGGYHYQTNPNLLLGANTNTDNPKGFSTGLGYSFGNTIIDLSYYQTQQTEFYDIYKINDINVEKNISRISATATFNF